MGKRKGNSHKSTSTPEIQKTTLREENVGRKHINVSSMLKLEHLQKLAIWASGETSIPSLAALFGQRLAACAESVGMPLERALFLCQRCETVLQPGDNCTIRIENMLKRRKSQKPQNDIVYKCHMCLHRNLIRGTVKGCVKELLRTHVERFSDVQEASKEGIDVETHVHAGSKESPMTLVTPIRPSSLLSGKKTRSLGAKSCKAESTRENSVGLDPSKASGDSNKRKRKRWSSLKDIVEKSENGNQVGINNLIIPLKL